MYQCQQSISCIKTARVGLKSNTYYIIVCDSAGCIYILKGFASEPMSYKLYVKYDTEIEIYAICTNPMYVDHEEAKCLEKIVVAQDGGTCEVYTFDF
jgi:hypothetical protein